MRRAVLAAVLALAVALGCAGCPGGLHKQPPPTVEPHQQ